MSLGSLTYSTIVWALALTRVLWHTDPRVEEYEGYAAGNLRSLRLLYHEECYRDVSHMSKARPKVLDKVLSYYQL